MDSKALPDKEQKFFFNQNIFDEDYVAEVEFVAPTFSEEDLEAARQKALAEGRQQGLQEAEESLTKKTLVLMEKIAAELKILGGAEITREKTFENEALKLCLSLFRKLFPVYHREYGFKELAETLTDILTRQEGQSQITITVAPVMAPELEKHLAKLKESGLEARCIVKGDEGLAPGAARVAWTDGGAIRNPEAVAAEITASVEQVLAKRGPKGHDSEQDKGETA